MRDGNGPGQRSTTCSEKFLGRLALRSVVPGGIVDGVEQEDDMERLLLGIRAERAKRGDLLRLAVVEEREVAFVQPGHWLSGSIGDEHVEDDVVRGVGGAFALLSGAGDEAHSRV